MAHQKAIIFFFFSKLFFKEMSEMEHQIMKNMKWNYDLSSLTKSECHDQF